MFQILSTWVDLKLPALEQFYIMARNHERLSIRLDPNCAKTGQQNMPTQI